MENRFYLFGVDHTFAYLDEQVACIEARVGCFKGRKIMLELAPNNEKLVREGRIKKGFFLTLAEHYRSVGAEVICGDQNLTIPENVGLEVLLIGEQIFYPNNRRDEIIRRKISRRSPHIVIVGNGHSDEIKEHFPNTYYTVLQPKGGYEASWSHHGSPHVWHDPDEVITLQSQKLKEA